jgi:hypothetical protein
VMTARRKLLFGILAISIFADIPSMQVKTPGEKLKVLILIME